MFETGNCEISTISASTSFNEDDVQWYTHSKAYHGEAKRIEGLMDSFIAVDERSDECNEGERVDWQPEP